MDFRHLQTFHTVLREGSFQRAALLLGIAQPTVSLHIQELESELGLELFDRSGRQRAATAAGALLASRALPILESVRTLSRSMAELRDGKSGVVRLGAIEPAASRRVTPLLSRLRADRPGLTIRLDVSGTTGVSRAVADADLDVGLCSAPPVELGLTFEPLYEEEMVLLLPRGHRLARKRSVAAADLDGEPLALSEQGCAYRSAIEAALQTRGVRPRWAFESGSTATLRAAVRHRLALAFLPRGAVQPPPAGTLARRLKDLAIALPVGLVTRPNAPPPPPALADLVALLRAELRATPSR